jgi:Ca2+-binding EF-hand superfamily protein
MAAAPTVTPRQTAQQIIGLVDSNKDGKISLQEYEAGPLGAFNKIDSNHDGTVSAAEIQAAKAAPKK